MRRLALFAGLALACGGAWLALPRREPASAVAAAPIAGAAAETSGSPATLRAPRQEAPRMTAAEASSVARASEAARTSLAGATTLRGRLVDADTGEGLPQMLLRIASGRGAYQSVESDGDGAFETRVRFPPGELEVELRDRVASCDLGLRTVAHIPGEELRLEARPGPTLRLALHGPHQVEAEHLRARVVEVRGNGAEGAAWKERALRPGPLPWLRGEPGPWVEHEGSTLRLEVRDRTDTLSATLRFPPPAERMATLGVLLEAATTTALGRVSSPEGDPLYDVTVTAVALRAPYGTPKAPACRSLLNGDFLLKGMAPGLWRLDLEATWGAQASRVVDLREGLNALEPFALAGPPGTLRIAATLAVPEGAAPPQARVRLHPLDGGAPRELLAQALPGTVRILGEGGQVQHRGEPRATVLFQHLPPGTYELEVEPLDGRAYERPRRLVEAGGPSETFAVLGR